MLAKFVFKSNSADKPPCKGAHEAGKPQDFPLLARVENWRRVLSNFHEANFVWTGQGVLATPFPEGTTWRSIEHVFQGTKFWIAADHAEEEARPYGSKKKMTMVSEAEFRATALKFTLSSGDPLGQGDGAAAQKGRKALWLLPRELDTWATLSDAVMASAAQAKYEQNPESMAVLRATAPAQLFHLMTQRGQASSLVHFAHLERIRDT